MALGVVKSFDARKGAGYIVPEAGGADVFIHISVVELAGLTDLTPGLRVNYDLQTDRARARSYAINLSIAKD